MPGPSVPAVSFAGLRMLRMNCSNWPRKSRCRYDRSLVAVVAAM